MRISTSLNYATDPQTAAIQARELEAAGVDRIWIPEAYGFDAVSLLGYLAASTSTVELASGILNTFSRTPALLAQTAAGLDALSGGRFVRGLGAPGHRGLPRRAVRQAGDAHEGDHPDLSGRLAP